MKKIEAVIRPSRLHALKKALADIGITGMTVIEVGGFGRQRGHKEMFRGSEYEVDLLPKILMTLIIEEKNVEDVIDKMLAECYTGKFGDGKIFVSPIEEVIRIRTKERGREAI